MNTFKSGSRIFHNEYLRYLLVGGITACLYFGAFAFGTEVLDFGYRIAVSVSYFLAVSFHFFANRKFTFVAADGDVSAQVMRYGCVLLLNYLITIGVISFLVELLFFSYYAAASIAIGVTVAVGYLTSKFWVFNKKEE